MQILCRKKELIADKLQNCRDYLLSSGLYFSENDTIWEMISNIDEWLKLKPQDT